MPSFLKSPASLVVVGVLLGYVFSQTLDDVPLINKLPKVKLRLR
jgi:hypothetical protein